jgi:hypothetical protein
MPAPFELCITDSPGLDGTYIIDDCTLTHHVGERVEVALQLTRTRERPRRNVIAAVPDEEC